MSILDKYDKIFISHLQTLIHRHFYIQTSPSLYLYMNEKRIKYLNIINMKKHIANKRIKILEKHGLKSHYFSNKEYCDHIKIIKNNIKMKIKRNKTE